MSQLVNFACLNLVIVKIENDINMSQTNKNAQHNKMMVRNGSKKKNGFSKPSY